MTRTLHTGINGSGQKVWIVCSTWLRPCGRKAYHSEYFTNEAEAMNWLKWA